MSKLAHSNEATMHQIEIASLKRDGYRFLNCVACGAEQMDDMDVEPYCDEKFCWFKWQLTILDMADDR